VIEGGEVDNNKLVENGKRELSGNNKDKRRR
jgi:hypothetical protein